MFLKNILCVCHVFNRRRIIEDETESLQRDIEHLKTRLGKWRSHYLVIISVLTLSCNFKVSRAGGGAGKRPIIEGRAC